MSLKEDLTCAVNWALQNEGARDAEGDFITAMSIRRMKFGDERGILNYALVNGSKLLSLKGYTNPNQPFLKGVIAVEDTQLQRAIPIVPCFAKFFNYGEPNEKERYRSFLDAPGVSYALTVKEDGVNVRPWYNEASKRVEFATRGTLTGVVTAEEFGDEVSADIESSGTSVDFGAIARGIAKDKYPILLDKDFVQTHQMVFELIHPECQILTDYAGAKELHLIGLFEDFRDVSYPEMVEFANKHGLSVVKTWTSQGNTFDSVLENLQAQWDDTDYEGTVVCFYTANETVYRLKVKNAHYLKMLRLARYCTYKRTVSTVKEHQLDTWEKFQAHLYATFAPKEGEEKQGPVMSEEVEMLYKEYFEKYAEWKKGVDNLKLQILADYKALPKVEGEDERARKKAWVEAIGGHTNPRFHYFTEIRKWEEKGSPVDNFWTWDSWDELKKQYFLNGTPRKILRSVEEEVPA